MNVAQGMKLGIEINFVTQVEYLPFDTKNFEPSQYAHRLLTSSQNTDISSLLSQLSYDVENLHKSINDQVSCYI